MAQYKNHGFKKKKLQLQILNTIANKIILLAAVLVIIKEFDNDLYRRGSLLTLIVICEFKSMWYFLWLMFIAMLSVRNCLLYFFHEYTNVILIADSNWRIKLGTYIMGSTICLLTILIITLILLIILNFVQLDLVVNIGFMILSVKLAIAETSVRKWNSDKNGCDRLVIRLEITNIFDLFAIVSKKQISKILEVIHNNLVMLKTVVVIQHMLLLNYMANVVLSVQINKTNIMRTFEQVLLRTKLDTNPQNISLGRRINIEQCIPLLFPSVQQRTP